MGVRVVQDCKKGTTAKMKLYLAAAVLMLVLAVHTEAQDEPTLEQQFAKFQTQVKEIADDLTEKTKSTFEQLEKSDFAVKTKSWFSEQFEKTTFTSTALTPKMSRLIFFVLVVTLQVCLTSSNSLPTSAPDNAGLLERAKQAYRDTKAKVLNVGSTVAGFAGMYYEEHLKPVTDPYVEWAKDRASSLWERVKNRVPTFRSTQDK
ncbi:hypothetical protein Q8A67_007802 [Cirrhinus molitorella]|uniref:Apolipoprotein C-IV n=1 Tax=Cirrhinus molitorella TaxID=172907 RepID=A0AA88PT96_9TELE|nr:hypothetical protein Q8A67_007802 [Cirrhinus molitorella]